MRVITQAHPNIALIKYWGKRNVKCNLPATSSLSVTLDKLWTRMTLSRIQSQSDTLIVNNSPATDMLSRVSQCLDLVLGKERDKFAVESDSNFPIAAGLASSSSAFSALVFAANQILDKKKSISNLSRLAGQISGSSARSLYGGYVELLTGKNSIKTGQLLKGSDWPLDVVVAITDHNRKSISSSKAMIISAETSPFYDVWLEKQDEDMHKARDAILQNNFELLADVSEKNCLKMHSVMWTSRPPIVYWNEGTINCMQGIRELRNKGYPVFFTIDAGPQVKVFCLPEATKMLKNFLSNISGVKEVLCSGIGNAPKLLDK